MRKILLIIFTLGMGYQTHATHFFGSDIYYTQVGKDTFDVFVAFYRDCKGNAIGAPPVDVTGIGCSYSKSCNLTQVSCNNVTPVCKTSCTKCSDTSCNNDGYPNGVNNKCPFAYGFEKVLYKTRIIFSNTQCCKFRIDLTACCTSLYGNIGSSALYTYTDLNRCLPRANSSPVFNSDKVPILSVNTCARLDWGATDTIDHDSISYHLSSVYDSYNSPVSYYGSYSYRSPLSYSGFPSKIVNSAICKGFFIDSTTGLILFKPTKQEIAMVAIELKEWRKDTTGKKWVNIGMTRRDMPVVITSAYSSNKAPNLADTTIEVCAGEQICIKGISSHDSDTYDSVTLSCVHNIKNATFKSYYNNSKHQMFDFCWQPNDSDTVNAVYRFWVTATDDACPLPAVFTKEYSIKLDKKPTAKYSITNLGCGKYYLSVYGTNKNASKNEIYSFKWIVPSLPDSIRKSKAGLYYFTKTGNWPIRLEVILNGKCPVIYEDTIHVVSVPFSVNLGPDLNFCGKGTALLQTQTSTNGQFTYQWNKGTAVDTLSSYIYSTNTKSDVACKVTDTFGCVASDTVTINIYSLPQINLGKDKMLCAGDSVALDAGNNKGNIKKYQWYDIAKGATIDSVRQIKIYKTATIVCSIADTNLCTQSDTVSIIVFLPQQNSLLRVHDTIYVSSSNPVKQYDWWFNYSYLQTTMQKFIVAKSVGHYQVTVIDTNGCIDTSQSILVSALYSDVKDIHYLNNINIYPNPSTGIYYIESNTILNDLTIYDLMGRKVYNSSSNKNIIDLSSQAEGIYLLQINGNVWIRLSKI